MKYIVGIDVGGTSVKMGLFDLDGKLLDKWQVRTNTEDNGKHILNDIYQSILSKKINLQEVKGYGFGVPGPVVNGTVISAVNLGWSEFDLALDFSQLVENSNVLVENDANVAALGEAFKGAAKGKSDVAMITLGTGVGGGIITNGHTVEGAFGAGGEIGHIVVKHENGRQCNCGNNGCLETIVSATGIKREFTHLMHSTDLQTMLDRNAKPSAKAIFAAARKGDPLCNKVLDNVAFYLGYTCHFISVTMNPEVIVFGGGVSRAGDFLLDKVRREFKKYKFIAAQGTKIKVATLGNDAGIFGAAKLIING